MKITKTKLTTGRKRWMLEHEATTLHDWRLMLAQMVKSNSIGWPKHRDGETL